MIDRGGFEASRFLDRAMKAAKEDADCAIRAVAFRAGGLLSFEAGGSLGGVIGI